MMKRKSEILLVALTVSALLAAVLLVPDPNKDVSLLLVRVAGTADAQTVERLIDAGADVNARDSMGMTALHWAAYRGKRSTLQMLLDKGADPDAANHDGYTPSMVAAERRRDHHKRLLENHRTSLQR